MVTFSISIYAHTLLHLTLDAVKALLQHCTALPIHASFLYCASFLSIHSVVHAIFCYIYIYIKNGDSNLLFNHLLSFPPPLFVFFVTSFFLFVKKGLGATEQVGVVEMEIWRDGKLCEWRWMWSSLRWLPFPKKKERNGILELIIVMIRSQDTFILLNFD